MSKKNSFTKYNSVDGANQGARLPILDADRKATDDWLHVLGTDSTAYQTARANMRRRVFAYIEEKGEAIKTTDDYSKFTAEEQHKLQAVLITGWSFEEPCNPANVLQLLTVAPYISEQVDEFAAKRSRFVKA